MKKLISIILTMCIISSLFCISVFAEEAQGEIKTTNLGNVTAIYNTATKVLEFSGKGEIPDTKHIDPYYDCGYYGLFDAWYLSEDNSYSCEYSAETLIIGEGITSIGEENFAYFYDLKTVVLPDSLKTISKLAFYNCSSLVSFNGNKVETVEGGAFRDCSNLFEINFPNLKRLTNNQIKVYDYDIEEGPWFSYPRNSFYIGAFQNCSSLIDVYMPLVEEIGPKTFYNCVELSSINSKYKQGIWNNYLDTVTYLGHSTFYNCQYLKNISLKKVAKLYSSKTMVDAAFPENKKEKAPRAYEGTFDGCVKLKKCYIPNVTYIGERTFFNCKKLDELCTNNNLKKLAVIGGAAFGNCRSLKNISLPKLKKLNMGKWYEYDDSNIILNEDRGVPLEDNGEIIVDSTYYGTFENCISLVDFIAPAVTKIGSRAFYNCTSLKTISLPKADYAGASAFSNCSKLQKVYLPKIKAVNICNWYSYKNKIYYQIGTFEGCTNLKTVTVSNASKLGARSFVNCIKLKSINISDAAIIAQRTFSGCASLTSINLGSKIKSIGSSAFYKCAKLKTVNIRGRQLSKVYSNAFTGIYPRAVFNCPKKQLAKYKKLIKSKAPKTAVLRGVY